ncbi:MAG: PTS sugar transporter subunit IIC [Clostridia bacterium]|nr:PTS sugar transporter subunit IIC [Clostridia bacterium]
MKKIFSRYFIDGLGAMAQGLFATLIIGTILSQIAKFIPGVIGSYMLLAANVAKSVTGAGIGVAVAAKFKSSVLVSASAAVIGMLGAFAGTELTSVTFGVPGEPLGAFVASVVAIEVGMLVSGKTKLDIIVTPTVSICSGAVAAFLISTPIANFMNWIGSLVNYNVEQNPVIGGIIVSVLMGMILTLPISSAAIGISLGLSGIAAGAACVGCCCQMVGFAVASYRDNGIGGLVSQGLGTSMLQVPNIMKKPVIWLAPICSSAVLGPVASAAIGMTNTPTGSGMGSAGLVGQFEAFTSMNPRFGTVWTLVIIISMHFILPALVTFGFNAAFIKLGWVRKGDMRLTTK